MGDNENRTYRYINFLKFVDTSDLEPKLNADTEIKELELRLKLAEDIEDYEFCCLLRDQINDLKNLKESV